MYRYNLRNIFWIGGSPCAGKSSISEMLVKKYNFKLYKCDDYLDSHMEIGAKRKYPIMSKVSSLTCDQIWMRDIDEQVQEEFQYYREELKLILEELENYPRDERVLVEGTAILPEFIEDMGIVKNKSVFIVPTAEFQLKHYKKREFIPYVLKGCTNQDKAYENWMERDIGFAKEVARQAKLNVRNLIIVDGKKSLKENFKVVENFFELT